MNVERLALTARRSIKDQTIYKNSKINSVREYTTKRQNFGAIG